MSLIDYPESFYHAVDRWQKGGDANAKATRGTRLKREVIATGDEFLRECRQPVYRRLGLPQSYIWTFLTTGVLPETISAWTVDPDIGKGIKGGVPPEWQAEKRWFGVILEHRPRPEEIVLNLDTLWVSTDYQRGLSSREPTKYVEGIRRYENSQREVVLEIPSVSLKHIYAWGGYSSPLEYFAELITGESPTGESLAWLSDVLEENNIPIGARWTTPSGARNVTQRVLDQARSRGYLIPNEADIIP